MKRIVVVVFSCILFSVSQAFANNSALQNVEISCDKKQMKTSGNEVLSLLVKIKNNGSAMLHAVLQIRSPESAITVLGRATAPIDLNARDSIFLPVKIFVPARVTARREYGVVFDLIQKDGGLSLLSGKCKILIEEKKSVFLTSLLSGIQIEASTDSLKIPVRIVNAGNTSETVTIINAISSLAGGNGFHASKKIYLPAFADTLIHFNRRITKSMLQLNVFDVYIKGLYQSGEIFGVSTIRVQGAQSSRVYGQDQSTNAGNPGYITVSSENTLNPYQSYNFNGSGTVHTPVGHLAYNLDGTIWTGFNGLPVLRNTWIDYQAKSLGLKIGNIDKANELNLIGRGMACVLIDSARATRYEAGVIDKSYNLIGEFYSGSRSPGWATWASFRFEKSMLKWTSTAIYDNSASSAISNYLLTNEMEWGESSKIRIRGLINAGYTQSYGTAGTGKLGMAAGLNVEGQLGGVSFNSLNFTSQPYYPGLRKGTVSLSEQINWTMKKIAFWTSGTYYSYSPKYLNSQYFTSNFVNLRLQAGMSSRLSKAWTFSLSPTYNLEKNNYYFLSTTNSTRALTSLGANIGLGCSISSRQNFYITGEAGIYQYTPLDLEKFHIKTNLSYHYRAFSFTSSIQKGSFLLGEQQNAESRNKENYTSFSAGPGIQKEFFKGRGKLYTGLLLMRSNVTGSSMMINARYEQSMLSGTTLFSSFTYNSTRYDSWSYNSNNLQLGITQKIPEGRIRARSYNLTLILFKDLNQNGIYDGGDSLAAGQTVDVDQSLFLSDQKATVIYKHVPPRYYTISVPFSKGWYCPEQRIYVDKNMTVEIPLQKTGTIEGSISFSSTQRSFEISQNRAGILITATDKEGHSYQTKTNEAGGFIFFLPVGKYTVAVQMAREEIICENNFQEISLDTHSKNMVGFTLKIKDRKIETKKFKSRNLQAGQP